MSNVRSVALTKDETLLLVQLVATNKIVTNKATNATNNQLKEEAWSQITGQFNASISSCPRTPAQLRLKWENLKKAARKRSANIRMNRLKTGGGKPDYICPDEALDQVAAILGATCDGFSVPYGGDACPAEEARTDSNITKPFIEEDMMPIVISGGGCNDSVVEIGDGAVGGGKVCVSVLDRAVDTATIPITTPTRKFLFGASSKRSEKRIDLKATKEMAASNIARNAATTKYYELKTKALEMAMEDKKKQKLELENIKLKLNNYIERIEHLEYENKKLRLELDELKNS